MSKELLGYLTRRISGNLEAHAAGNEDVKDVLLLDIEALEAMLLGSLTDRFEVVVSEPIVSYDESTKIHRSVPMQHYDGERLWQPQPCVAAVANRRVRRSILPACNAVAEVREEVHTPNAQKRPRPNHNDVEEAGEPESPSKK